MFGWFDKHKKQQRVRREQTLSQPIVEITGLLSRGAARLRLKGAPEEEVATIKVWRVGDGPLEPEELRLVQEIVGDDLPFGSLWGLPSETVIRTKARLLRADEGVFGIVAGLTTVIEPDKTFADAIERWKNPPTINDPHLGTLTADDLMGWVGEAKWLGSKCNVSVDHLDDLPIAHALWNDQQGWTAKAVHLAVSQLLELKNDVWLGEDEKPLSAAEFGQRLKMDSITVGRHGAFELWFNDGDLFWGHAITLKGNLTRGLTHADIAG